MRAFEALLTPRERQLTEAMAEALPVWRELSLEADLHPDTPRALEALGTLYRTVAELGLQRARSSEQVGGLALSPRERLVLLERMAWADAGLATAVCATWSQAAALEVLAPPALFQKFVAPCLTDETGEFGIAGAASEPEHGSEVHRIVHTSALGTHLRVTEEGLRLNGMKWMMTNGGRATVYVVLAQREGVEGLAGRVRVLVPAQSPGVLATPIRKRGLRTAAHATLQLNDVVVAPEQVLPQQTFPEPQRRAGVSLAIASELLNMSTIALGIAQAAVDEAKAFTRTRVQSGRPLAQEPTIALRLLELQGAVDVARAACWVGAELEARRALTLAFGASAKAAGLLAARAACAGATDVVGSAALEDPHLLSKLTRDVDLLSVGIGTTDFWRAEVAALDPGE